ncbi:MAG TPA: HEAT repeat domain-containing protein, partial [Gemmatimonadales bacterium]|nr:HEAT repeat domain-containing protein [Gemmatimonadales bacterium]
MTRRLVFALALALLAAPAAAQRLAARIAAAPDGRVHFTFAARAGVCGNGRTMISTDCTAGSCGNTFTFGRNGDEAEVAYDCEAGPVRVSLTRRGGSVASLHTYVGGRWVTPPASVVVTDLGAVATREAVDYLLDLAAQDGGRAGEQAIFAATIADSVTVWPTLLKLARDEHLPHGTRRQAVFWLGQAAGDAATAGLTGLTDDSSVNRDVKEQAVFALSQRPREEGVPALIRVARANPDR